MQLKKPGEIDDYNLLVNLVLFRFGLWCLMPLSTIFQLYRGSVNSEVSKFIP
jgi:hypothetical protein